MKRADAVLNQVCSLAINYHKAQTNVECAITDGKLDWVVLIQFFYELKITFALLHFENAQMQSIISKDRLRHQLSFYGVLFVLSTVISHVHITSFKMWHHKHP
ncbi:hypothetical protein T01_15968 [Trichinella spiralis]|uniref:Uncharacterized protein n=1 Tax=Trichinella spiralis TaxID=6334 RepID=A0A0V1BFX6_TRISP|nr:hypothetical protein T01_15968 [Trichinella spiralis]